MAWHKSLKRRLYYLSHKDFVGAQNHERVCCNLGPNSQPLNSNFPLLTKIFIQKNKKNTLLPLLASSTILLISSTSVLEATKISKEIYHLLYSLPTTTKKNSFSINSLKKRLNVYFQHEEVSVNKSDL